MIRRQKVSKFADYPGFWGGFFLAFSYFGWPKKQYIRATRQNRQSYFRKIRLNCPFLPFAKIVHRTGDKYNCRGKFVLNLVFQALPAPQNTKRAAFFHVFVTGNFSKLRNLTAPKSGIIRKIAFSTLTYFDCIVTNVVCPTIVDQWQATPQ